MKLQIGYLRSLEDSERTRSATVKYLQTWLRLFLEDRMDLVQEMQQLAVTLGGQLQTPRLPGKYSWIEKLFGWPIANRIAQNYNRYKSLVVRFWDKTLFYLERCRSDPQLS
jgi:hypothetical protein